MGNKERLNLLLLPGLVTDARLWSHQTAELSDLVNVQVVDISRSDSMTGLARDALSQCPPGPFAIVGLSMGAYIAFEIIRQAAERVVGLAVLDSSARPDTAEASDKRRQQIADAAVDYTAVVHSMLPKMVSADAIDDPAIGGRFTQMALAAGADVFARQQRAIIGRSDSRPLLPTIHCSALVLCGREDVITPVELHEEITSLLPHGQLEVIEQCGHLSALNQPAAVTAALHRWLLESGLASR